MPKQKSSTARAEPRYATPAPRDVPGAWFDQPAVDHFLNFSRFCRHTKGRWAGRPIVWDPWQVDEVWAPVFGWKHPDGRRITRTVWLEVPKKNGKSTMCSVLGLYLAGPDDELGAEVYAAATDRDQARVVFEPATVMVERSPALARRFRVFRNTITYPKNGSYFRVVSAEDSGKHGFNIHGGIVDEVHAHKTRALIDALEYGTASREQPLMFFITTAGEEGETSIYAEKHNYCRQVAEGLVRDTSFHGRIYAATNEDDWRKPKTWIIANPGLGVSVSDEYLESKVVEAEASPGKLNVFLRYHLNVRTKQTIRWLAIDRWDASRGTVREASLKGKVCYGGLDASRSQDIAAFVLDFPTKKGHKVLWRFWLPEAMLPELDEQTAGQSSRWVREGKLKLTRGDVIDYKALRKAIESDAKRFDVSEIAFNRRGSGQLAQELDDVGITMVEMAPGITLAPATQEWERLVLAEHYEHGGHPVARYMVDGLTVKQDADANSWPDKGRSVVNISGPIAAVMALDRCVRNHDASDVTEAIW